MTMLRSFGPEFWFADGSVVSFHGFRYPTRMAVIRLGSGGLFVWSPIALCEALRDELAALGPVTDLVSPNKLHHFWLGEWKNAYPAARLHAPPGLPRKRPDLRFDAVLGDKPDEAWAADIDQVRFSGSFAMTEIVFLHRTSRTAVFADLIQNFPPGWFTGWRGRLARWGRIVAPDHSTPRDWRSTFWRRDRTRHALQRILDFKPERVLIAHGDVAASGGTEFIREGLRWLL